MTGMGTELISFGHYMNVIQMEIVQILTTYIADLRLCRLLLEKWLLIVDQQIRD